MKVLYSRVTRAIKAKPKIESLCDDLTLIGIEVDEIKSFHGDKIIDFDLTPNRGDCFSVKGLARDYCAFKNKKLSSEIKTSFKGETKFSKKIKLLAREGCSAYSAVSVSNLKLKKKFPDYIKKTLKAAGIQSIHPLVDIVNFVMLESGQPMHVFDQDKIEGDIEVRFAKTKEKIKILGEKNLRLTKDCLVISDEKEPIAFAGISGGLSHSVSKKTQNFLIESAFFDPSIIKGKARRYGFQTDASQRFERGVDFNLHEKALQEALSIIQEIYQADISNIKTKKNKYFPRKKLINIATEDVNLKLGTNLKENTIKSILKRLEIKLVKKNQKNLVFEVPSHRFDLSIKEDLVEEIARIVGYDNLPQIKNDPIAQHYEKSDYDFTYEIKTFMVNKGFNEVINYSFLDKQALENLGIENKSISLKNPLNNSLSTLRTSLLPSLASNL
jgi:phenylalanyl-tRNA synthetase beta chain